MSKAIRHPDGMETQGGSSKTHSTNLLPGQQPRLKPDLAAPFEKDIEACQPLRNVDWRGDAKPVETSNNRNAAHGQRCGATAAPQGKECNRCKKGDGVFGTCVVNFASDSVQSKGACMNCVFDDKTYSCTLREHVNGRYTGRFTEAWVTDYVAREASRALTVDEDVSENHQIEDENDDATEYTIERTSGSVATNNNLSTRLLAANPIPPALDGGPGWNPRLYASVLHQAEPLDANTSLQRFLDLAQLNQRLEWEAAALLGMFGDEWNARRSLNM
ncbi:uncharacterized protein N7496_010142 [Penicillium cataractarum]|uniref:Uncharacterized protein n=1 Tax=Penicillium cataractarum TaxID=2100454 RepID=A0A9W9RSY2_9EURO|nr:uncharacterized protein N7496_010142 [Penicillium cataractarum]KAJ5364429.1 hypothetical protein N7496_010142 [Penicillium cataractarum]